MLEKLHRFAYAPRLLTVVASLCAGCGDDDSPADHSHDAATHAHDSGAAQALYAIQASITLPGDGRASYVALVPTLDKDQAIDYDSSLEIAAGAGIFGPDSDGYFIVGRADEPTLQRYEVTGDNKFKPGKKLSLAAHGVTDTWAGTEYGHIYDDKVAYAFAGSVGYWMAEFNPSDMTLTRFIANDEIKLPDSPETAKYTGLVNGRPHRVGSKVYVPLIYRSAEDDAAYPLTTVTVVDMATGEITYTRDERCGPALDMSVGPDGFIYVGSYLWRYNPVGRPADPPACLLRIDPKTDEFDPDYHIETKEVLGGGREVASVLFAGDGTPFSMVFHSDQFEITPTTKSWETVTASAWTWLQLDPALDQVGKDLGGDFLAANIATHKIAGETFIQQASNTHNGREDPKSTFLTASKDGLKERISMRGYTWGIVKLR